jgi:hypothetical protein
MQTDTLTYRRAPAANPIVTTVYNASLAAFRCTTGFEMDLGKEVICCVNDAEVKKVKFVNRQYNFLRWTGDDLPTFQSSELRPPQ